MLHEPVKLLLVDDLQENVLALNAILNREEIELYAAHSGPDALELLLQHEFALAVVDVQMPGMDGFELAELMRGMERTRHVPIIFVTAADNDSHRRFRGYESGAVDFLFKPVEAQVLLSKASVFINLHQQKQEILAQRDALKARQRELQSLSDHSPNIITRFDRNFRHVFVSQAIEKFTGRPAASFLHKSNRELGLDEHLCEIWEKAIDGVFQSGTTATITFDFSAPVGMLRFESQLVAERQSNGEIEFVLGVTRDITKEWKATNELSRAKEAAEAANKAKDSFLAMMSHELRTPMTAILGYTDLVLQRVKDEELIQYLQTVRKNGDYLLEIINDILDISKIEAAKLDVEHEEFNLRHIVDDVMHIMEVRASEKELQLQLAYDSALPTLIHSDQKRLKQILINLLGNAIKFTERGEVCLQVTYHQPNSIQFDVIDTGIGISQDHIQQLFQPFTQVDTTVSRRFGGTGLGLAISLRLATLMGGTITAQSEPNKGSIFSVTIPIGLSSKLTSDTLIVQPLPNLSPAHAIEHPLACKVLVVDDRRDIRFLSKHLLTNAGATVVEAEDGQLAIDYIKQHLHSETLPDLILLDMHMPVLDGYSTASQLRILGYDYPIIALTGNAMQEDRNRCLECGCSDYLSKPIDAKILINTVRHWTKNDHKLIKS